jgi:hypothetical protein
MRDPENWALNRVEFQCAKRHKWVAEMTSDGPKIVDDG